MDKKKSGINVAVAIVSKVIMVITSLVTRILLVRVIGDVANGVNSLFTSIIGFLSVVELGIGSAIIFSMYKPIQQNDTKKISALYHLYVKVYLIVGIIVLAFGLVLTPFLPYLVKDSVGGINLYVGFIITLIGVLISYTFSAKTSLINAFKNNYVISLIVFVSTIAADIFKIVCTCLFKSLYLYLGASILCAILQWLLSTIYVRKHYKEILDIKSSLDDETKKEIVKNTKAMFCHKIGSVLVNTVDSVIISAFIGIVVLGKYTNYVLIMTTMTGIINLFFTPMTAIVGHMFSEGDLKECQRVFGFLHTMNFIIGTVFFLGYYGIIDNIISICFGSELVMGKEISFIITLNYFIQFMRVNVLMFRDASGTFYYDWWKPILEGILNIILSIIFVQNFGVVGVIVATIITNLLICLIVEPFVLFRYGFKTSPKKFYLKNYLFILIFAVLLCLLHLTMFDIENTILQLLANGFLAVGLACIPCLFVFIFDKNFRKSIFGLLAKIFRKNQ